MTPTASVRKTKIRPHVTQEYQKGFEAQGEPGLVWMYDKVSREFRKVPVAAAAQATGLYDADTERRLNEVAEGPALAALGRLRKRGQHRPESGHSTRRR